MRDSLSLPTLCVSALSTSPLYILSTAATHIASFFHSPSQDEATPDRVFDDETGYKGRVSWGFSNQAELVNGRFAMMGFTVAYLQEAIDGHGVLEQYGLGYDEGAIVAPSSGFVLPGIIALVFSLVVTAGLSLAGVKAVEALGMEKGNYLEKNGDKLKSLPLVGGFF